VEPLRESTDATASTLNLRKRSHEDVVCPLCRDALDDLVPKRCAGCATLYHDVCLDELGYSCTTLGCQGSSFLEVPRALPKAPSKWKQLAPLGVLALGFLLLAPLFGGTDWRALAQALGTGAWVLFVLGFLTFVASALSKQVSGILEIAMQSPDESERARKDRELRERLKRERARRRRHEQELEERMRRDSDQPFTRGEPKRESSS